jgi:hypothetical protein
MNIYFLVEGKRTEMKVYPKWLAYLVPELQKVQTFDTVHQNNYFMFSGNGFPSLLHNHLRNCVLDINDTGKYDYFVICLDADEKSIEDCKQEVVEFMLQENIYLNPPTQFKIIVQNRCLETWFLANPKIFKKNPHSDFLRKCVEFYNVKQQDPELMDKPNDFESTISVFHSSYLQELLAERNIIYTKKSPQGVTEEYFLRELILRSQKTNHISSFQSFIEFCEQIRLKINK